MNDFDWTSPSSEGKKQELIGQPWGSTYGGYLYYEIGDVDLIQGEEMAAVIKTFFVSGEAGFGDVELHASERLPKPATLLRLRGQLYLHPSLTLRGRYCPLYQFGHRDALFSDGTRCINFAAIREGAAT